jgi:tetratricopeptide (TPR) repeat protein
MSNASVRTGAGDGWLREDYPDLFHMLRALEGDEGAFVWLENKSAALALFTRAIAGDRKALTGLQASVAVELKDLHGTIDNGDPAEWLRERRPELQMLFDAIKGDDTILRRLKRKKASLGKVALVMRELYQKYGLDDEPADLAGRSTGVMDGGEAADVGCLIGEMHLSKGDYAKAVEAFTRSLESNPTADAYAGRAKAYRALALADDLQAQALRGNPGDSTMQ